MDPLSGWEFPCYGPGETKARGVSFDNINQCPAAARMETNSMSFIGDLIGGIGEAVGTVAGGIGSVVAGIPGVIQQVIQNPAGVINAIQGVQGVINTIQGDVVQRMGPAVNNNGTPMAAMGLELLAQQAAAACGPFGPLTAGCHNDFAAGLQRLAGGSAMMVNPTTGTPMASGFVEAGVGGSLVGVARTALMNPSVQAALRAVGLGGLIAAGEAGVSALAGLGGGGSSMASGPLLMNWPAGTTYPRSIVLRAPDKPEKRFRTEGAALLRSGDIAAVRRVQKAAGRARKGRRRSSARPQVLMLPANGTRSVCGSCLTSPCGCK